MWCLEPDFGGGLVSVGLKTVLITSRGFLQPNLYHDSMIPLQQVGDLRGVCKLLHKPNNPWLSLGAVIIYLLSCKCSQCRYKIALDPSQDHTIVPTLPPSWWASRLGSSSMAEIHSLLFHIVSTVSLPWALISQLSTDHLYTFFLVLEVRNLPLMKLKGHHFFQQQSGSLQCSHWSLWSWHTPTPSPLYNIY